MAVEVLTQYLPNLIFIYSIYKKIEAINNLILFVILQKMILAVDTLLQTVLRCEMINFKLIIKDQRRRTE